MDCFAYLENKEKKGRSNFNNTSSLKIFPRFIAIEKILVQYYSKKKYSKNNKKMRIRKFIQMLLVSND